MIIILTVKYLDSFTEGFFSGYRECLMLRVTLIGEAGQPETHLNSKIHINDA